MKKNSIIRVISLVICIAVTAGAVYFGGIFANNGPERKTRKEYKREPVTISLDRTGVLHSDAHIAAIVPDGTPVYITKIDEELKKYGITLDVFSWADVEKDLSILSKERYKVVIYSDAYKIPDILISPVSRYINSTGGFICIGGPAFEDIYKKSGSEYIFDKNMTGTNDANKDTEHMGEIQLDCLCPAYQTYPVTNAVSVVSGKEQVILNTLQFGLPDDLFSPSPRAYGTGFNNLRAKRFIPLIEALDKDGEVAGYAAHLILENSLRADKGTGKMYASFNSNDEGFLETPQITYSVSVVAAYMQFGIFLYEGGAGEYAYRPEEEWTLGAKVLSSDGITDSTKAFDIRTNIELEGKSIFEKHYAVNEAATEYLSSIGKSTDYICNWTPEENGYYDVVTEISLDGVLLDSLSQTVDIYEEKPENERVYLKSKGYDLYLGDKVWKCFGVNYMPSSCIAREGDDYEKWLSASAFEPEVVRKDLKRIKSLGMNAISSFVYYDTNINNNNLLKFINLCDQAGLKLYLSIRTIMEPFYYNDSNKLQFQNFIERFGLKDSDTIIGYDIAWETMPSYKPSWCNNVGMILYDNEWTEWLKDNYGSVEKAEEEWGYQLERDENGNAKGLEWINAVDYKDEARRKAVIAYRRWMDDKTAEMFAAVCDDLHDVDPNHLISARLGMYTGWPNAGINHIGWEYSAVASSLDIMGPEGYGYYSTWDGDFETAAFSVAYSRASCERPLIWFEFGTPCWTGSAYSSEYDNGKDNQLEYFKLINRALDVSQSNGIFYWWYAGGYRMNEGSDYGIINPDGSYRPVTKLLKDYAKGFKKGGAVKLSKEPMKIKADASGTGVCGVWNAVVFDFQSAVENGKVFSMQDPDKGTTSLDTSIEYLGKQNIGPVRNLNSDIRRVWYKTDSMEDWHLISEGGTIVSKPGEKISFKLTVSNTGIAKWICKDKAGKEKGAVRVGINGNYFDTDSNAKQHDTIEVDGMEYTVSQSEMLTLRMNAEGRTDFGEFFKINILVE